MLTPTSRGPGVAPRFILPHPGDPTPLPRAAEAGFARPVAGMSVFLGFPSQPEDEAGTSRACPVARCGPTCGRAWRGGKREACDLAGLVFFTRSSRELSEPTCFNRAPRDFNPFIHNCWGWNIPEPAGDRSWSHPLHSTLTENSLPVRFPLRLLGSANTPLLTRRPVGTHGD